MKSACRPTYNVRGLATRLSTLSLHVAAARPALHPRRKRNKESCRVRQFPPRRLAVAGILAKASSDRPPFRHRFHRSGRPDLSVSLGHDENGLHGSDRSDQIPGRWYLRTPPRCNRRDPAVRRENSKKCRTERTLTAATLREGRPTPTPYAPSSASDCYRETRLPGVGLRGRERYSRNPARPPRITASTPQSSQSRRTVKKAPPKWHG